MVPTGGEGAAASIAARAHIVWAWGALARCCHDAPTAGNTFTSAQDLPCRLPILLRLTAGTWRTARSTQLFARVWLRPGGSRFSGQQFKSSPSSMPLGRPAATSGSAAAAPALLVPAHTDVYMS